MYDHNPVKKVVAFAPCNDFVAFERIFTVQSKQVLVPLAAKDLTDHDSSAERP